MDFASVVFVFLSVETSENVDESFAVQRHVVQKCKGMCYGRMIVDE